MRWLLLALCIFLTGCGGGDERSAAVSRAEVGSPAKASVGPAPARDSARPLPGPGEDAPGTGAATLPPVGLGDASASCAGTALAPSARNLAHVRSATLCVLNAERAARRMPPLRRNELLERAALRHTRDMVARAYFSHHSPSGESFVDRVKKAGYMRGARGWAVGENIAWAGGPAATPSEVVRSWMASAGHRANILSAGFREIGIGVVPRVPVRGSGGGATYNTDFGARR